MKTRDWVLVVATLFLAIIVDQASKIWAWDAPERWIGPLHLILVQNDGAMLGLFSKLPAFLRVVTLSTSGFFILSLYAFLQFLVPVKVLRLRFGLSLLVGGILGNVLDRTYHGFVIDFISFQIGSFHTPIWNAADMIQWVGYILLIYSLFKDGKELWPDEDVRSKFWINKKFQLKYALIFITSGVLISLICMVFSYTYFKLALKELGVLESHLEYTKAFLFSFGILVLSFSVGLFAVAKFISHRIAGPVYAFERFLDEALADNAPEERTNALKLRAGDDFKHLEELAEKIQARIKEIKNDD